MRPAIIIICLALTGFALQPKQEAPSVVGTYTRRSPYTFESMSLHPDSTYRYSFNGCMASFTDSGTYNYHNGIIRLSSVYEALKDSLPYSRLIRSWNGQGLWLCGDKLFCNQSNGACDLNHFMIKSKERYDFIFANKGHLAKAGIMDKQSRLISGLEYVYDARDSLVEVKFTEGGRMVKDSLLR